MKKLFLLCFLLLCFPTCVQAKTVYVSVGETIKLPSGGKHWKSKDQKIAKVIGKKGKGIKKGITTFTYQKKKKTHKLKVVVEKPYFSVTHVGLDKKFQLKGTRRSVDYTSSDDELVDDSFSCPEVKDSNNVGGGIVQIDAKVGTKTYSQCMRVGNILPYEFIVKKGSTMRLFDKKVMKKLNLTIHVNNPSIVSVSRKGLVTGKQYGFTTIWLKYKGKKYYCKVFCLPKLLRMGMKSPYFIPVKNMTDYQYLLDKKTYQELQKENITFHINDRLSVNDKEYDEEIIAALYSPNSAKIYGRKGYLEANYLVHEVGHFLDDRILGGSAVWYTDCKEFQTFRQQFLAKYPDRLTHTKSKEVLAELYMEYVLCPYRMKDEMPIAYRYMDNLLKKNGYQYHQ